MVRSSNRNRYDIYSEVLQVLKFYDGAGISVIGRRANLPLDRAKEIVQFMITRGLVIKLKNEKKRPLWVFKATSSIPGSPDSRIVCLISSSTLTNNFCVFDVFITLFIAKVKMLVSGLSSFTLVFCFKLFGLP